MLVLEDHTSIFCSGCGAEINWAPFILEDRPYCCADCSMKRECKCGAQLEWEDERRKVSSPAGDSYT